jgi:RNA-directed DNA polymerase
MYRTCRAGKIHANFTGKNSEQGKEGKAASILKSFRLLNEQYLEWVFQRLNKKAASGVDQVTYQQYETNLKENIAQLVEKLRKKRYRAKLVRRKCIPKANGKTRPLGLPALEDKLLQTAASLILQAIYEQDFLSCSYGYRLGTGARAIHLQHYG